MKLLSHEKNYFNIGNQYRLKEKLVILLQAQKVPHWSRIKNSEIPTFSLE